MTLRRSGGGVFDVRVEDRIALSTALAIMRLIPRPGVAVGAVLQMGVPIHLSGTPGRIAASVSPASSLRPMVIDLPEPDSPTSASPVGDVAEHPPLAGVRVLETTGSPLMPRSSAP